MGVSESHFRYLVSAGPESMGDFMSAEQHGLLGEIRNHPDVIASELAYKQQIDRQAKWEASSRCESCTELFVRFKFQVPEEAFAYDMTNCSCLYEWGNGSVFWRADCGGGTYCPANSFYFDCNTHAKIRDEFKHPLKAVDEYMPESMEFELPFGVMYGMHADWESSHFGSGVF